MRISLSKPDDPRGKHLVFTAERFEMSEVDQIIRREVVPTGRKPVRETVWETIQYRNGGSHRRVKHVLYRFHRGYLERLSLTFPHAELTPAAERFMRKQSRDIYADLPIPKISVPGFKGKLWNFQKVGAAHVSEIIAEEGFFEDVHGGFLNDEMGLGKTVQALAGVAIHDLSDVLVVTTNSGKWAWKGIAEELFPSLDLGVVDGTKTERRQIIEAGHQITVINVESLRMTKAKDGSLKASIPELFDRQWSLLIMDETHKVKNPDAQQTIGFLNLDTGRDIHMSGTPFLNRPDELWPSLHRIAPDIFPDFKSFVANLVIDGPNGKPIAYRPDKVKEVKDFLETYGLRRRKDQVLKDLPQVVYSTVMCELTTEQRELYKRIKEEFLLLLENGEVKTINAVIAQVTRLKQACFSPELYGGVHESAKITQLKEVVAELVSNGEKAIIFSQWSKATRVIERELAEYNPAYVDGSVKGVDRKAQQDKFNNDDDCYLYIGTIRANQEAITLSKATYVIFTDKDWTPLANAQAEARSASGGLRGVHLSKDDKVNIINLYAVNTIEKAIDDLLASKQNVFNAFIERDGGAQVNRKLIDSIRDLLTA